MSEYLNEMIGYNVSGTAEWRRQKADQFPNDTRNAEAAEELERLAREIDALEGSEIERQINDAHDSINKVDDGDAWMKISEAVSDQLRSVGFHSSYETAAELLEWYRDTLNEQLRESKEKADGEMEELELEAVPVPELRDQVEKDPGVKRAKRAFDKAKLAYEEAYRKAEAEARKTI
jgi:hypothetical protein